MTKHIYQGNFLTSGKLFSLPSNLLTIKKQHNQRKKQSIQFRSMKLVDCDDCNEKCPKHIQSPNIIGEKNNSKEKSVLYKRLSNMRGQNKQIEHLSFSKMLSKMVIAEDKEVQLEVIRSEPRMGHTMSMTPIENKVYHLNYSNPVIRTRSKSTSQSQAGISSRKLFKKYYLPCTETAQTFYLQTGDHGDKYIYRDGKKVQCKRIHNFYTSHMFRNGYGKCFRKTSDSFKF